MRKIIVVMALVLWACGAPSQVDSAKAQENQAQQSGSNAAASDAPATTADADPNHPLGAPLPEGVPTPEQAPDQWREVAPENLLYLKTLHGITLIEMAPEFAPNHVQRMRELASSGYFVGLPFHRVIKNFMAQAGDGNLVKRPPPTTPPLKGEFRFRRSPAQKMVVVGEDRSANTGFVKGFPVASQPDALAMMTVDGKVQAWALHCQGAASMARTNDPDSANAQFYITTGNPEWLNGKYTSWGRVRAGQNAVQEIKLGAPAYPPDMIDGLTLGSKVAPQERARVWVLRTDSPAFANYLEQQKDKKGKMPGVCKIPVPVYVQWANTEQKSTPEQGSQG
ncbi:MAG: peptidylprolyl isomerase [Robiginitomaculum sp.]|nr:peptidylprolyl isomerase [Robiginitomaculum sp.]MDQ7077562.1 peptidylprolyl isomerase [Robiginitomaculum sp.]